MTAGAIFISACQICAIALLPATWIFPQEGKFWCALRKNKVVAGALATAAGIGFMAAIFSMLK